MENKEILDISNINHIDIAGQIDNPWERDSILALVNKSKNICCTIRLKNSDKIKLKKEFINSDGTQSAKRHNKKVINLIFAYIIFKVLDDNKNLIDELYICPDHRPSKEVHHYLQKVSYHLGYNKLTEDINIHFLDRSKYEIKKNTPAHKIALKILKGKKKSDLIADFKELYDIISKLL